MTPELDLNGPQLDLAARAPNTLRFSIDRANDWTPPGFDSLPVQLQPYVVDAPVFGLGAPVVGVWRSGQVVRPPLNSTLADSGIIGWRCVQGGKPGVWKEWKESVVVSTPAFGGSAKAQANDFNPSPGASDFKPSTPYRASRFGANALVPPAARSLEARAADRFNVKDFGARGDGSGLTPADTDADVAIEHWNNWRLYPFFTNHGWSPYWQNSAGKFMPPRSKPFLNSDTWDSIGINLAIWTAANKGGDFCGGLGSPQYNRAPTGGNCSMGEVLIPAGNYQINVDGGQIKIMKGMEVSIRGAGMYHTTLQTKENSTFFGDAARSSGKPMYELINAYRPGGPPTYIEDLALMGCQASLLHICSIYTPIIALGNSVAASSFRTRFRFWCNLS